MISLIKKIKNKFIVQYKIRVFKQNSLYGKGTCFDAQAACRNGSKDVKNILIGNNCMIRGILTTCGKGKIVIGDNTYLGIGSHIGSVENVTIGNDVIIAGHTHIYDNNNHPTDPAERLQMTQSGDFFGPLWSWERSDHKQIIIEDNVWIGEKCAILKGVKIGKGAIVGCNSVVTHDVPEYTIVAGNPAKIVKNIIHELTDNEK